MSRYSQGRDVEYAVIDHLKAHGYDTIRAASSKGLADVVAIGDAHVLLVNCKRTQMPGPGERADLLRVAARVSAIPLVALKPFREALVFRRLTGPGPRDWYPWITNREGK